MKQEINPCLCGQLIFDKGDRRYNGVKIASSINGARKTELVRQKNETRPPTHTIHQNKLKRDKRIISCDTIKVLEEIIGSNITDIPCSNIFAIISPRAREV